MFHPALGKFVDDDDDDDDDDEIEPSFTHTIQDRLQANDLKITRLAS